MSTCWGEHFCCRNINITYKFKDHLWPQWMEGPPGWGETETPILGSAGWLNQRPPHERDGPGTFPVRRQADGEERAGPLREWFCLGWSCTWSRRYRKAPGPQTPKIMVPQERAPVPQEREGHGGRAARGCCPSLLGVGHPPTDFMVRPFGARSGGAMGAHGLEVS